MELNEQVELWIKAELAMNGMLLNTKFKMWYKEEIVNVSVKANYREETKTTEFSYEIVCPAKIVGAGKVS